MEGLLSEEKYECNSKNIEINNLSTINPSSEHTKIEQTKLNKF